MEYNMEDILARLKAGEDADTIANQFTEALNGAVAAKKKEDEQACKAKEQAYANKVAAARNARIADAWDIADPLNAFMEEHYPNLIKGHSITAEEIVDLCDSIVDLDIALGKLSMSTFPLRKKIPVEIKDKKKVKSDDDIIKDFIRGLF